MKGKNQNPKFLITKQIFIAIAITCVMSLYFIYFTLFGSKGVVKYFKLNKELQEKEFIKESLENKMKIKQNMVNGMNLESLDLDLLDEEARKNLGYANKNEIVIYHEKKDGKKPDKNQDNPEK